MVTNAIGVVARRLHTQHLAGAKLDTPHAVVSHFGAVQAQDYLGALWAVGLRMRNAVEADVERALTERSIVRLWPQRADPKHFFRPPYVGPSGWLGVRLDSGLAWPVIADLLKQAHATSAAPKRRL